MRVGKATSSCINLFKALAQPQRNDVSLKFVPPTTKEGKQFVVVPKKVVEANNGKWKHSLLGYVIGAFPNPRGLAAYLRRLWGLKGMLEVQP